MTYCEESNSLYCSIYMAFAKPSASDSSFIKDGMSAWKHVHQRTCFTEHEGSKIHGESAEAHFLRANKGDIGNLLTERQISAHRDQIRKKLQVMERMINVIKVISKRGLSYRDDKHKCAYSIEEFTLDHGRTCQ